MFQARWSLSSARTMTASSWLQEFLSFIFGILAEAFLFVASRREERTSQASTNPTTPPPTPPLPTRQPLMPSHQQPKLLQPRESYKLTVRHWLSFTLAILDRDWSSESGVFGFRLLGVRSGLGFRVCQVLPSSRQP